MPRDEGTQGIRDLRKQWRGVYIGLRDAGELRTERRELRIVNVGRNFPRSVEVKFPTLFGR
ncbi:hypothetical protein [Burkholderia glumae]|uniref:hypothetical protein n=1 Tax=Burkholderia glumae TaxID=337 RepID=UPI002164429E|nr:hypothetical protein [Burkholderia glumae]